MTGRFDRFRGLLVLVAVSGFSGCGGQAAVDQPVGYKSHAELKARLLEVSKYGDGGSSLGGISESIAALTKDKPELGQKLQADFQKLNTTDSKEQRKKIAQQMADQIE